MTHHLYSVATGVSLAAIDPVYSVYVLGGL